MGHGVYEHSWQNSGSYDAWKHLDTRPAKLSTLKHVNWLLVFQQAAHASLYSVFHPSCARSWDPFGLAVTVRCASCSLFAMDVHLQGPLVAPNRALTHHELQNPFYPRIGRNIVNLDSEVYDSDSIGSFH